jgi:hypothetical protein
MGLRPSRAASIALAIAAITSLALAGCASSHTGTTAAAASHPPATVTVSATASQACADQALAWKNTGAADQVGTVGSDTTTLQGALYNLGTDMGADGIAPASDQAAVQSAASSLQADAQAVQGSLPPACIPGARRDESAMLTSASKAAISCQDSISELGSANYTVADADIRRANSDIKASDKSLQAFTADLKKWEDAGEPG